MSSDDTPGVVFYLHHVERGRPAEFDKKGLAL